MRSEFLFTVYPSLQYQLWLCYISVLALYFTETEQILIQCLVVVELHTWYGLMLHVSSYTHYDLKIGKLRYNKMRS